ncbi:hypothetical protein SGUI_0387 [Serinicoccus hydrothermalis]|uniref:Uncharacterized protein n=1 Tax=Serinicoccus hydrothermalis TaxID=1758689 RepID=A0A1B1N8M3_9MICO|nr:hypothetical protein SGUI_0387 [Serinicoccus hydrothermalis]
MASDELGGGVAQGAHGGTNSFGRGPAGAPPPLPAPCGAFQSCLLRVVRCA